MKFFIFCILILSSSSLFALQKLTTLNKKRVLYIGKSEMGENTRLYVLSKNYKFFAGFRKKKSGELFQIQRNTYCLEKNKKKAYLIPVSQKCESLKTIIKKIKIGEYIPVKDIE